MLPSVGPAYWAVMVLAFLVGGLVKRRQPGPRSALSRAENAGVLFGAIVGGTVAAKLPFVLGDWEALLSGAAWLENGRTLTLGLLGGYLGVEIAKLSLGIEAKTGDALAAPLAATIGVARIGCFVGGCCFGRPSDLPWAHDFGDHVRRHPTQLYEAAFHLVAAVVLFRLARTDRFRRQRIKLYLAGYFVFRFFTEWLRPEPIVAAGLTFYQCTSIFGLIVMVLLFRHDARALLRESPV